MPKPKAYALVRFSTKLQEFGESYSRQTELIRKWKEKNPGFEVVLVEDLGVSAYFGNNLRPESSEFGKLYERILNKELSKGDCLLVENEDRLTRLPPGDSITLIQNILREGVPIYWLQRGEKILPEDRNDLAFLLTFTARSAGNNAESAKKQVRLLDTWARKRRKTVEKATKLTRQTKAWLEPVYDTLPNDRSIVHKYKTDPEKAKIVKNIYELYGSGKFSYKQILSHLLKNNVPPIAKQRHKRHKRTKEGEEGVDFIPLPTKWTLSYITQILADRSVLGEATLHTKTNKVRRKTSTVIKDYYPRIISDELFEKVAVVRSRRQTERTRRQENINTFSGLVWNGWTGSKMFCLFQSSTNSHRLVSADHIDKLPNASPTTLPWTKVEDLLLLALRELNVKQKNKTVQVEQQKETLHKEMDKAADRMRSRSLTDDEFEQLSDRMRTLREELTKLSEYVAPTPTRVLRSCILREDKAALKEVIPTIVDKVVVFPMTTKTKRVHGLVVVILKNGEKRWCWVNSKQYPVVNYHRCYVGEKLVGAISKWGYCAANGFGLPWAAVNKVEPADSKLLNTLNSGKLAVSAFDEGNDGVIGLLEYVAEQAGNPYGDVFSEIRETGEWLLPAELYTETKFSVMRNGVWEEETTRIELTDENGKPKNFHIKIGGV